MILPFRLEWVTAEPTGMGREAEIDDENHMIICEKIENEYYIHTNHPMTKQHYISFIAYITYDKCEIKKLYPEQISEARFFIRGKGILYVYCNKDGLIMKKM